MYHLLLKSVGTLLHKLLFLLYMDKEFKKVFSPSTIVSCKSSRTFISYLVRVKLYPLTRSVGSFKYIKRRREVCVTIIEIDTFTSKATPYNFRRNHSLNCDDTCLIYFCLVSVRRHICRLKC